MRHMSDEEFEAVVQQALDELPERFRRALDNVGVCVQDEPDDDQLSAADEGYGTVSDGGRGELLGLYEGLPLTERGDDYGAFGMDVPDVVTVFQGPHERCFATREEMVAEVKKTVIHEIGHYFGLDEDQLDRMGYR